jgi:hypothetical protein
MLDRVAPGLRRRGGGVTRRSGRACLRAIDAPVGERLRNFYLAMARAYQNDLPAVRATMVTGSGITH